jgi:molybdate transport system permease protein
MWSQIAFPLRLSLQVATFATIVIAVVGIPLAYLLATRSFPGKNVLEMLVTLPLVLPPVVVGYYLLLVIGNNGLLGTAFRSVFGQPLNLTFTWYAAVLAATAVSFPLTVRTAKAAIQQVDPKFVQASQLLGRNELQTALRVTLPLSIRGVLAGLVLSFARALGEFGATIMVAGNIPGRTNTMAIDIFSSVVYGEWATATSLVLIFTFVSAVFLLLANKWTESVAP